MQWFTNLKIGVRLGLSYAIIALVLIVVIVVSFLSLNKQNETTSIIVNDRYPKTVWANNIINAVNDAARAMRNLVIVGNNPKYVAEVKSNYDRLDEAAQKVNASADSLSKTISSEKGKELLANVQATRQKYYDARKEFFELLKKNKFDEAGIYLIDKFRTPQNDYINACIALIDYQNKLVREESAIAAEEYANSNNLMLILSGVALIGLILIAYLVTMSIKKPIEVATEVANQISQGNMDVNLDDNRKDEIGLLFNAMITMRNSIKNLIADANMLAKAAVEGKLATRADATKHQGDFRKIVEGVNETLDAVIGPLNVAAEYVDRIAKGDIPNKITDNYNGDFNEIKNNLNLMIDTMGVLVDEIGVVITAGKEGKLSMRSDSSKVQGVYRKLLLGVNETLDAVIGPLNVAAEYIDRIAKGDTK